MNNCCKGCSHRKIPASLKHKLNEHVVLLFDECPLENKDIYGCTTKYQIIDWKSFSSWLNDNKLLSKEEIESLKLLNLYKDAK